MDKNKLDLCEVQSFAFTDETQSVLRIMTTFGQVITAKRHHRYPNYFGSQCGRVFTIRWGRVKELDVSPGYAKQAGKPARIHYKLLRSHFKPNIYLHAFIWECWHGPRDPEKVIDHVNGNRYDNRLCNLEQVTPRENQNRFNTLRWLRNKKNISVLTWSTDKLHAAFDIVPLIRQDAPEWEPERIEKAIERHARLLRGFDK